MIPKRKEKRKMFYEVIKELTFVRYNNTIWKEYGENFHRLILTYGSGTKDIYNKQLYTTKQIAKRLDVPVDFILSILKLEGVEEYGSIQEPTSID